MASCVFGIITIMGEKTMFILNEQIGKWRESLAQSQTLGTADIDELESHLRQEIESLQRLNLSDEEAFLIAGHRLGSTASLTGEFAKVNRAGVLRLRLTWMIIGILAYLLATFFIVSAGTAGIWLASIKGVTGDGLEVIALVSNVAILGVVLCLCYSLWCCALRSVRFKKWSKHVSTRLVLLVTLLAFLVVEVVSRVALPLMAFRVLDPAQGAQAAQISAWTRLAWSTMLPVILVIVLIKLAASSRRALDAE